MIEQIRIAGLGVIDQAVLDFSPGLTVLTGETGAGKTMVLTSLRLLMGEKGDSDLVRQGHNQIEVDGILTVRLEVSSVLKEMGFAAENDELIISRTVPKSGRTRALLNGRPVPLKSLSEVAGQLVTIHGQSDQWKVRRANVQREMLDAFAGPKLIKLWDEYQTAWKHAVTAKNRLDELHANYDQRQVEIQYLQEVTSKIFEFAPQIAEEESLTHDIERLANVADLHTEIANALELIQGDDEIDGATDRLGKVQENLNRASRFDETLTAQGQRLAVLISDVKSLADDLRAYVEALQDDPATLSRLYRRRADLETLLKGRANSAETLLEWAQDANERLMTLTTGDTDPAAARETLESAQAEVLKIGERLRKVRQTTAQTLGAEVNAELAGLSMPNAKFRVLLMPIKPGPNGLDEIEMELQAHTDAPFRPLGDGASGGELSRVMLALEVALGAKERRSTYVFDEVDAGVGGRTAIEVGRRLAQLAENQQVVVVTHLAQVAAFAGKHLVVRKDNGVTKVIAVKGEERVNEIVRMMGGQEDSLAARRHALELLSDNTWKNRQSEGL